MVGLVAAGKACSPSVSSFIQQTVALVLNSFHMFRFKQHVFPHELGILFETCGVGCRLLQGVCTAI